MTTLRPTRRGDHEPTIDSFDDSHEERGLPEEFPCVFYEADEFLKVHHVSGNVHDLIGIQREQLIGLSWFFDEAVVPADRALLQLKLADLSSSGETSLIHRLIDDHGRIVRVAHSLRRITIGGQATIRGNLLPLIGSGAAGMAVDVEFVSTFIHKIGNHFQLLNLMLDSMRHKGAIAKDLELVQETSVNAIDLTQMFSRYLEQPELSTKVILSELLATAVESRAPGCRENQIGIVVNYDDGFGGDAAMCGDAVFLDLALGAILDNAINASPTGGVIVVEISAPPKIAIGGIVRTIIVRVMDNGSGLPADQLDKILEPFHTMRPGRDDVSLSLACRYIDMHGGILKIQSCEGKGTNIEITLPIVPLRRLSSLQKRNN